MNGAPREKVGMYGWQRIVQLQYGKPLMQLLREQYQESGTVERVAEKLGVSRQSIYVAMRQRGIKSLS